jgi:hypothetical protein
VDVVDVVEVVVVVDVGGELVDVVGEVLDARGLVSGGELVDVGGREVDVDVGGGMVEVIDERMCLGADVVGVVAQVWAGSTMVAGGASVETGDGIVGGGAGAGVIVVGGEATWRTRWLRVDDDDMIPTSVPATVAMTTTVARPTAIGTLGRSTARERARLSHRERDGEGPVTSSIVGGLDSVGSRASGSAPLSSAKNTKDGFGAPASAEGAETRSSPPSTAASSARCPVLPGAAGGATGPGGAAGADDAASVDHEGSLDSMAAPVSEPRWRLESERSTSIACSWCSTDRRSFRFDDQVS